MTTQNTFYKFVNQSFSGNKPICAESANLRVDGIAVCTIQNLFTSLKDHKRGDLSLCKVEIPDDATKLEVCGTIYVDKIKILTCVPFDMTCIQTLVNLGADISENDCMLLQWACENGKLNIVEYLVSSKIDVNADDGQSLVNACEYGHKSIVKSLVGAGAKTDVQNSSPLRIAQDKDLGKIAKLLEKSISKSIPKSIPKSKLKLEIV